MIAAVLPNVTNFAGHPVRLLACGRNPGALESRYWLMFEAHA
jgi:hypothetical protein